MTFQSNKGKKIHNEEWKRMMSEKMKGNSWGFKKGQIPWNKGKSWPEEIKKKVSISKKGSIPWNKNKFDIYSEETKKKMGEINKGKRHSIKTEFKKGEHRSLKTEFKKGEMSEKQKGENNSNWQGGKSFEPYTIDWTETLKRSIRERDKYLCQICNLYGNNVHHIDYDKKNCNTDNLITLCDSCHRKTGGKRDYWINYFIKK